MRNQSSDMKLVSDWTDFTVHALYYYLYYYCYINAERKEKGKNANMPYTEKVIIL